MQTLSPDVTISVTAARAMNCETFFFSPINISIQLVCLVNMHVNVARAAQPLKAFLQDRDS